MVLCQVWGPLPTGPAVLGQSFEAENLVSDREIRVPGPNSHPPSVVPDLAGKRGHPRTRVGANPRFPIRPDIGNGKPPVSRFGRESGMGVPGAAGRGFPGLRSRPRSPLSAPASGPAGHGPGPEWYLRLACCLVRPSGSSCRRSCRSHGRHMPGARGQAHCWPRLSTILAL